MHDHLFFGPMRILAFVAAWPLCYALVRRICQFGGVNVDWRVIWAAATICFGLILTLIVEISSAFDSLNAKTLLICWIIADLVLLGLLWRQLSFRHLATDPENPIQQLPGGWPLDAKVFIAITASLVMFLFAVAVLTPTTNGDSLSYHLARMAHWIDQQSVKHFPTDDTRQLEFGPWSSFAMTNLFLLWGNDRLLNLVQWFAMISSAILLTWVAEQLALLTGRSRDDAKWRARLAALTVTLAVTLPIGVVEAISTQNDYTTGLWLLCLVVFAFLLSKNPASSYAMLGAGSACGLGVLTKATTYIYAAPLVLAGGLWWLWSLRRAERGTGTPGVTVVRLMFCFVLPFAVVNLPHITRNYAVFHSPLGSPEIVALERNREISPAAVASNAIRNLALHASTGIPPVTAALNGILEVLHTVTGKDLNDSATTYEKCPFQFQHRFSIFDSSASCTFHLLAALGAIALAVIRFRQLRPLLLYSCLWLAGALIFCAFLKWQPWHSRLHLPWLLLLMPVVAVIALDLPKRIWIGIGAAAIICGSVTVVFNSSRPVFQQAFREMSRERQYLVLHDSDLAGPLAVLADKLVAAKPQSIGLKADFCGIEYPLWIMLRNRGFAGRFSRCQVQNVSAAIRSTGDPNVIVTVFNRVPEVVARSYPYSETYGRLFVFWSADPNLSAERAERN